MPGKELVLGLCLSEKTVLAAEIEQEGVSNTLTAIDEWVNTLSPHAGANGHSAERFLEFLAAFIKVNRVKARRVSVALDSSQLFLNSLPMEDGLSQSERNEHLNWELGQFFPERSSGEFITDTHVLTSTTTEPWSQMLSVSVRRADVYALQQAMAQLDLNLHIVDVDHFSADTALRINYPDTNRKVLALVGVKENRVDISMINSGNVEGYSYRIVDSNQQIVDCIAELSREAKGIHAISAYGTYLDKDLLVQIRRASSLLVEALNPLRHVKVSDSLRLSDHLTSPSYRYAAAVGVALRRE